jgi:CheY-like chemotaxis protein
MRPSRTILLVEADSGCGQVLAALLRRQGDRVRLARTRAQALLAARRQPYDLAIVDVLMRGGGAELARELSQSVPRLCLSLGARLEQQEILEAALGFPVHRKAALPALLRGRGASSSDRASAGRRLRSRRPARASSAPAPGPAAPGPGRGRRHHD